MSLGNEERHHNCKSKECLILLLVIEVINKNNKRRWEVVRGLEGTQTFEPEGDICKFRALLFAYFVSLSSLINLSQKPVLLYKMGIMKFSAQDFAKISYTHRHLGSSQASGFHLLREVLIKQNIDS